MRLARALTCRRKQKCDGRSPIFRVLPYSSKIVEVMGRRLLSSNVETCFSQSVGEFENASHVALKL